MPQARSPPQDPGHCSHPWSGTCSTLWKRDARVTDNAGMRSPCISYCECRGDLALFRYKRVMKCVSIQVPCIVVINRGPISNRNGASSGIHGRLRPNEDPPFLPESQSGHFGDHYWTHMILCFAIQNEPSLTAVPTNTSSAPLVILRPQWIRDVVMPSLFSQSANPRRQHRIVCDICTFNTQGLESRPIALCPALRQG